MGEVMPKPRRTEHVVMQLITAFDLAQRAFSLDARPGRAKAFVDLQAALTEARDIGDVGTLPCPLTWWSVAQVSVRAWLEAPNDNVRRGLSDAVNANIRALSKYASGEIEMPEAPHGVGVR